MKTILVVDDEYLIAAILSVALEEEGFLTVTASNARIALDILKRKQPDLIITDYMMPGMTGLEFAEGVRSQVSHLATPIILMSGAQAYLGNARPDLFAHVYAKPFDIAALVGSVKNLLNGG